MHSRFLGASFAGLFLVASAVGGAEPMALLNAGFEEGLAGWTLTPANSGAVAAVPGAASLGRMGLRVQAGAEFQLASTPVSITAGQAYAVEFWAGGGQGGGGETKVEMVFQDGSGQPLEPGPSPIRKWPAAVVKGAHYWGKATLAATAPAGAVRLLVRLSLAKGAHAGAVEVDDFRLVLVPAEKEVVEVAPGQAHPVPPFDPELLKVLLEDVARDPHRGHPPVKVVLKLDDLKPLRGGVHPAWAKWAKFAQERGLKMGFGIIANGLEGECVPFVQWAQELQRQGTIEFWQHGYDHASHAEGGKQIPEFAGMDLEYQQTHFAKAQALAREKLGFPFVSFGAPENAANELTARIVAEDADVQVWMYGNPAQSGGKTVLERAYAASLESPTFIPNYAAFVEGYAHNRTTDYLVLQGHPTHWDAEREQQFTMLVDFLVAQQAVFVSPRELARAETKP